MKTLLLAACFAAASILSSCTQDPQSANGGPNLPLSPGTTPAHPAVAYRVFYTPWVPTITVMDTDGTHQTHIWTGNSSDGTAGPSWSPTGGSIAWDDNVFAGSYRNMAGHIYAIDVSVNSSGTAVGSNFRSVLSWSSTDSVWITPAVWCQQSTTGKIAFMRDHQNVGNYVNDLCVVNQDGSGSVTTLASRYVGTTGLFMYPAWSPDDSKIAVYRSASSGNSILIFNASTGALLDSIATSLNPVGLKWSHTGQNKLLMTSTTGKLYYLTPSSGSTPTTNNVACNGNGFCWSPNNSGILFTSGSNSGPLKKDVSFSSSTRTVLSSFSGGGLDWRQH